MPVKQIDGCRSDVRYHPQKPKVTPRCGNLYLKFLPIVVSAIRERLSAIVPSAIAVSHTKQAASYPSHLRFAAFTCMHFLSNALSVLKDLVLHAFAIMTLICSFDSRVQILNWCRIIYSDLSGPMQPLVVFSEQSELDSNILRSSYSSSLSHCDRDLIEISRISGQANWPPALPPWFPDTTITSSVPHESLSIRFFGCC